MRLLAAAAALIALVVFAACGDDEDEETTIDVVLEEFSIEVSPSTAPPGSVTFDLENEGDLEHEFIVLRTDFAPDELPTNDDGTADTGATGVNRVGERVAFEGSSSGVWNLDEGAYVLICNLKDTIDGEEVAHYAEGMRVAFTVEASANGESD